jgi:hypothetical protein
VLAPERADSHVLLRGAMLGALPRRDVIVSYRVLLLCKFVSVLAYAGGFAGAFLASSPQERRRAVHAVAGPSLLCVWVFGYLLSEQLQVSLMELWILGGLVFSSVTQMVLSRGVARDVRGPRLFVAALIPLLLVVGLMVFRPTWSTLAP